MQQDMADNPEQPAASSTDARGSTEVESNTMLKPGVGGGVDEDNAQISNSKRSAATDTNAPSKGMRADESEDPDLNSDNVTMNIIVADSDQPNASDDQMLQAVNKPTKQHNRTTLGNNTICGTIVKDDKWSEVQKVGNTEWLSSVVKQE